MKRTLLFNRLNFVKEGIVAINLGEKVFEKPTDKVKCFMTTFIKTVKEMICNGDVRDPLRYNCHSLSAMYRLDLYSKLEDKKKKGEFLVLENNILLLDAFLTVGKYFDLTDIVVFVEVKQSTLDNNHIWAEVYYVVDCQKVASIIRLDEIVGTEGLI